MSNRIATDSFDWSDNPYSNKLQPTIKMNEMFHKCCRALAMLYNGYILKIVMVATSTADAFAPMRPSMHHSNDVRLWRPRVCSHILVDGDGLVRIYTVLQTSFANKILEKIEFKAVIDADDYIQNSNINAEIKYFNEGSTGSYTFSTHANAHNGDDWNGSSITSLDNSTVVEYAEEFKNPWGRQHFVRGLNQALQNDQSDSGYIFINPQNFRASGIITEMAVR